MITINTELQQAVKDWSQAFEKKDNSSTHLFVTVRKLLKGGVKGSENRQQHFNLYTKLLKEVSGNNNSLVVRGRRVYKLAESWTSFKAVAKEKELHFYNLEAVVKLFVYLEKEDNKEALKKVREAVKDSSVKGETKQEYNNTVAQTLKDLRKEFGVVEVEGEFRKVEFFKVVTEGLTHLTQEELTELLTLVQETQEQQLREVA